MGLYNYNDTITINKSFIVNDPTTYYTYTIKNGDWHDDRFDTWISFDETTFMMPSILTPINVLDKTFAVPMTEEKIEEYILDNFDKNDIEKYGDYIYDIIQEKTYNFILEIIKEFQKDYTIAGNDKESIIDAVFEAIDFNAVYKIIDDILDT